MASVKLLFRNAAHSERPTGPVSNSKKPSVFRHFRKRDLKKGLYSGLVRGDFYLNLLNDQQRVPDDRPSIGIILCAEKSDIEVEYALRSKTNPIGVAQYELQTKVPAELEGKLPTAEQLASVVRRSLPNHQSN